MKDADICKLPVGTVVRHIPSDKIFVVTANRGDAVIATCTLEMCRGSNWEVADYKDRLTSNEWLCTRAYEGVKVLDPDGWDRVNLEDSMAEPITCEEFEARLMASTCQYPAGFWSQRVYCSATGSGNGLS
jgi:hypothetical protein